MNPTLLLAIDRNTEEVIVSESHKGSNQVNFIARIPRNENELLFDAVTTLTRITTSPNFDPAIFKAMDKVCQMIYKQHMESR
jgi:hypothetical protein